MQEKINTSLITIITDWIERDPLLSKHIYFDLQDLVERGSGGLFLGCCKEGPGYAVGYVAEIGTRYNTMTWSWEPMSGSPPHSQKVHHPGDPQFFENLKTGLINGHNSITPQTGCKI